MVRLLRNFRFSLLSLLLFTALIAVILNWFMPFSVAVPIKALDQYDISIPEISESIHTKYIPISKEDVVRVNLKRNLFGGYQLLGPFVCRNPQTSIVLYGSTSFFYSDAVTVKRTAEQENDPFYVDVVDKKSTSDRKCSIVSIVFEINSHGKIKKPIYFVTDRQQVLYSHAGIVNESVIARLYIKSKIDPILREEIIMSDATQKTINAELHLISISSKGRN